MIPFSIFSRHSCIVRVSSRGIFKVSFRSEGSLEIEEEFISISFACARALKIKEEFISVEVFLT